MYGAASGVGAMSFGQAEYWKTTITSHRRGDKDNRSAGVRDSHFIMVMLATRKTFDIPVYNDCCGP